MPTIGGTLQMTRIQENAFRSSSICPNNKSKFTNEYVVAFTFDASVCDQII